MVMPICQRREATPGRSGRPPGFALSSEALTLLLDARGLTVGAAAAKAGVPRPTLSGLKGGHAKASASLVLRLAGGLNVAPSLLFPDFGRGEWLTEEEAAAYLGLPRGEVRRLARLQRLRPEPDTGKRFWFPRAEVDRFAVESEKTP